MSQESAFPSPNYEIPKAYNPKADGHEVDGDGLEVDSLEAYNTEAYNTEAYNTEAYTTKAHESKAINMNDGKKMTITVNLNPVECLLFFNLIRFNRCPEEVDWVKVAEHSNLKNPASAKVRFRQILKKHGLEDLVSTPRRRAAVGSGGGRKCKKTKLDAAVDQDDDDGPPNSSTDQYGIDTAAPRLPVTRPQAQLQTPQFSNEVQSQICLKSPLANNLDSTSQFAVSSTQHQHQHQHQKQKQKQKKLPTHTQGNNSGPSPMDLPFDPDTRNGLVPIVTSVNRGSIFYVTPEQFKKIQEQMVQPQKQSGNVGGFQQMSDMGGMDNIGGMGGMGGDMDGMGVNIIGQSAQMNQLYAASMVDSNPPSTATSRNNGYKMVNDPDPYRKQADTTVTWKGGNQWVVDYDI